MINCLKKKTNNTSTNQVFIISILHYLITMIAVIYNTRIFFVRKNMFTVISFLLLFCMFLSFLMSSLALTEWSKVIIDFFMTMTELVWVFFVLFFWSHVIADELKDKTMFLLRSRRSDTTYFLLGKFIGFAIVLLCIFCMFALAFLLILSIENIDLALSTIALAMIWSYIKIIVLLTCTIFFAICLSPYVTMIVMIWIYFLWHAWLFLYWYTNRWDVHPSIEFLSSAIYYVFPPFDSLSLKEYISINWIIHTPTEIVTIFVTGLLYWAVFLYFACVLMRWLKKTSWIQWSN